MAIPERKILSPKGRPSRPLREIRAAIRKVAAEAAQTKGLEGRSKAARKAGVTRTANKTYRVVLDAIAQSEECLAGLIAKSEANLREEFGREFVLVRRTLAEIDRSVKILAENLLAGSERAALKRVAGGR